MKLRSYQQDAIDAIYRYFRSKDGNPLVVLHTGAGKSVIAGEFIKRAVTSYAGQRVLLVTHVKELIEQNHAKLKNLWPEAPAGIYSAGLGQRQIDQITVAGIQSVHRRGEQIGHVNLVIVDEAHLIPERADGMYRRLLNSLQSINPKLKVVGMTATPYRMKSGLLTEGKAPIFDEIIYESDLLQLVSDGYLAPLVSKQTSAEIDTTGVHVRNGDYIQSELLSKIGKDHAKTAAAEIIQHGHDRKSWLVFAAGVDHAHDLCAAIAEYGISCRTITGETPAEQRDSWIADYRAGQLRCLCNCNVLTTGFDAPGTDLMAVLRPTKSAGLYVQMMGRGMRTAPGKTNCLVLDFGGNVRRHGPLDSIRVTKQRETDGSGIAPVKVCPECDSIIHAAVRTCPDCGHLFPPPAPQLSITADSAAGIMTANKCPQTVEVTKVMYQKHQKSGSLPSLRADYYYGLHLVAQEWICLEHTGYPRELAWRWWATHSTGAPIPRTVDDALERVRYLRTPTRINIVKNGKYARITGRTF